MASPRRLDRNRRGERQQTETLAPQSCKRVTSRAKASVHGLSRGPVRVLHSSASSCRSLFAAGGSGRPRSIARLRRFEPPTAAPVCQMPRVPLRTPWAKRTTANARNSRHRVQRTVPWRQLVASRRPPPPPPSPWPLPQLPPRLPSRLLTPPPKQQQSTRRAPSSSCGVWRCCSRRCLPSTAAVHASRAAAVVPAGAAAVVAAAAAAAQAAVAAQQTAAAGAVAAAALGAVSPSPLRRCRRNRSRSLSRTRSHIRDHSRSQTCASSWSSTSTTPWCARRSTAVRVPSGRACTSSRCRTCRANCTSCACGRACAPSSRRPRASAASTCTPPARSRTSCRCSRSSTRRLPSTAPCSVAR